MPKALLINVTGGDDVTFGEIEEITDVRQPDCRFG